MTTPNGTAWSRVQRIGSRLGTEACEICGHQTGVSKCWSAEESAEIDRQFREVFDELVEKARGSE